MMDDTIAFRVQGVPKPGGSKTVFWNHKTNKPRCVDACKKNREWRACVMAFARQAYSGPPLEGAIYLDVTFYMPRPRGHYGTGRNAGKLKPSAARYPTVKPDRTKLLRSTEDALTDCGMWRDDAQVISGPVKKFYEGTNGAVLEDGPGAYIKIQPLEMGDV